MPHVLIIHEVEAYPLQPNTRRKTENQSTSISGIS